MREIVHIQAGQCGNQIGSKVRIENQVHNNKMIKCSFTLVLGSNIR